MYNGPLPVFALSSKFMGQTSNICPKELQKPLRACGSNYNLQKKKKNHQKTPQKNPTKSPKKQNNNKNKKTKPKQKKNNPKGSHRKKIGFPHNWKQYFQ